MDNQSIIEVSGKYSKANVYASVIESEAIDQIKEVCNQPFSEGSYIAVMPDVHSGKGCTIGFTMTLKNKVCPNLVGVDIGCGVLVIELGNIDIDFKRLDEVIHSSIPSGIDIRCIDNLENLKCNPIYSDIVKSAIGKLDCITAPINFEYELKRLGTLGSGNHYIEVDIDSKNNKYLVIHTGSRHLGISVCNHYMEVANEKRKGSLAERKEKVRNLIDEYKKEGRQKEIESGINHILDTFVISEIDNLVCVEGKDYEDYLHDMDITQKFAELNRNLIARIICEEMGWNVIKKWDTIHNYIDLKRNILRKGAISLENDTTAIIPLSMKDGALIVNGKGNPDYNYSGPHGAGRLMSRNEARKTVTLEDFKESMNGIYTTSVNTDTIDESPFVYKCKEDIIPMIEDTAEVINHINPIYNFKASDMRY